MTTKHISIICVSVLHLSLATAGTGDVPKDRAQAPERNESIVFLTVIPTEDGGQRLRGVTRLGLDGKVTRLHATERSIHSLSVRGGAGVEAYQIGPADAHRVTKIGASGPPEHVAASDRTGSSDAPAIGGFVHSRDGIWTALIRPTSRTDPTNRIGITGPGGPRLLPPAEGIRCISHLAWSPDGKKIAFYFARTVNDADPEIGRWGCAVIDPATGATEVLSEPSPISQWASARRTPPRWSPDGEWLYFAAATKRGEGEQPAYHFGDAASCYRAKVATGEVEFVSLGSLWEIHPDGSYLVLGYCPGREFVTLKSGKRVRKAETWTVRTDTLVRTVLPDSIYWPKISPSGRYALANLGLAGKFGAPRKLGFFRTSDWTLYRNVEVPGFPNSGNSWADHVHWVTSGNASGK